MGHGCMPLRRSWKLLHSTRFVTIYGFVQSNIQHLSPASGDFAHRPHRGSAPGPRWGTSVSRPLLLSSPRSKYLATPLLALILSVIEI